MLASVSFWLDFHDLWRTSFFPSGMTRYCRVSVLVGVRWGNTHDRIYTHTGDFWRQESVWVVQQWLSHTGKANNLMVVQSPRLNVSTVPIWHWHLRGFLESCWSSVCIGIWKKLHVLLVREWDSHRIDELACKSGRKQAKGTAFLLYPFPGLPPEDVSPFRVRLPLSNDLIR